MDCRQRIDRRGGRKGRNARISFGRNIVVGSKCHAKRDKRRNKSERSKSNRIYQVEVDVSLRIEHERPKYIPLDSRYRSEFQSRPKRNQDQSNNIPESHLSQLRNTMLSERIRQRARISFISDLEERVVRRKRRNESGLTERHQEWR
jgi:hypothetical protein